MLQRQQQCLFFIEISFCKTMCFPEAHKLKKDVFMPYLDISKGKMYYEVEGIGQPLLLIAGLSSDISSWLPIRKQLAKKYRIIMCDNRGIGKTINYMKKVTIKTMTDDIFKLLEDLNIKNPSVLGHSMGGCIAMQLAINQPKKIRKLILSSCSAKFSARNKRLLKTLLEIKKSNLNFEEWLTNLFYWIFSPDNFEDETFIKNAFKFAENNIKLQTIEQFALQVEAILNFNVNEQLSKINTKTLLIAAENDILTQLESMKKIESQIPNSKLVIIRNCAHSIPAEKPLRFAELITNYLG